MQCRNFFFLFSLLLLLAPAIPSIAQGVIRENEKGEKIIVYPDGSWRFFNQIQGGRNYPVIQSQISTLDNPVLLTEEDARRIASRRAQLAKEASVIAQNRAEQAFNQRAKIESEVQQSAANPENLQHLNLRLNAAKRTEQEAKLEAELARQELSQAEGLVARGNILQEFKKSQANRASQIVLPKAGNLATATFSAAMENGSGYYMDWYSAANSSPKTYEKTCRVAFSGVDESTGRLRKDLEPQLLFTYTDERLRVFLKEKEYLRCEGFLSASEGFRFLTLQFTFAYPNAREAYGFIEKGSVLTIKLLNGQYINLQSGAMDRGRYDTQKELLTYVVQYPIDQSLLSLLQNSEAESVRVFWSSGYEEYPVFSLDFFMHQLRCLER